MQVLGVVTARGGSKGVPRKNIRLLGGKPLLVWTAEAAKAARRLARAILSTDDEEIAAVGRAAGLDVPFLRPAELADDHSPTLAVLQHAVRWLEERGERYDAVCLLQPTNPLRTAVTIDACIARLVDTAADAVVTVLRVPAEYNPHWVYFAGPGRRAAALDRGADTDPAPAGSASRVPPRGLGLRHATRRADGSGQSLRGAADRLRGRCVELA